MKTGQKADIFSRLGETFLLFRQHLRNFAKSEDSLELTAGILSGTVPPFSQELDEIGNFPSRDCEITKIVLREASSGKVSYGMTVVG